MDCVTHKISEYGQNCKICIQLGYLFSDTGDYSNDEIRNFSEYYHNSLVNNTKQNSSNVKSILCKTKKIRWNAKQKEYLLDYLLLFFIIY